MKTLRNLTMAIALFAFSSGIDAQTMNDIPAYRQKGYAGSVSFTDQYIVWLGLDTSHGYMFNEHHYLGAGVGFFLAPIDEEPPMLVHGFLEYKSYWFKRRSTPTAGVRAGFGRPVTNLGAWNFKAPFLGEPYIGWDWGTRNGNGLSLTVGASVFMANRNTQVMPKLSLGISF